MTTTPTQQSNLQKVNLQRLQEVITAGLDYSIFDLIKMELESQCSEMDGVEYANLRDEVCEYVGQNLLISWK